MSLPQSRFESLVEDDWERAVAQATAQFESLREQVLAALESPAPQVRSAAVAVLLEAEDHTAHDSVVGLLLDPNEDVRTEVLEYLAEFAKPEDAKRLLAALKSGAHSFLATSALCRSMDVDGPVLDDEDPPHQVAVATDAWEAIVRGSGHQPRDDA